MATISNVVLSPAKIATDAARLSVTIKYTLFPNSVEKLAGSVFQSSVSFAGMISCLIQFCSHLVTGRSR